MAIIAEKLLQGKIKAVIDRQYRPNEIQEAYRYVASGQKTGSVILDWQLEEG